MQQEQEISLSPLQEQGQEQEQECLFQIEPEPGLQVAQVSWGTPRWAAQLLQEELELFLLLGLELLLGLVVGLGLVIWGGWQEHGKDPPVAAP